ncbi:hypothetical protein GCM10011579_058150 [Streptomyces albiflavescens]|uniref:Uncharacterized protein n=1 Tax=Streptomyces albiflavescens TaxID=1623582 RepID=A0A917Y908_9ACTN|nr:hypothetical protein [Streptomyces albiflavescens]GGN76720.1 hypothetical protein GCM10011579_058150 [Streptomyces albiflavescens]
MTDEQQLAVRRWDSATSARVRSVSLDLPSMPGAPGSAERTVTLAQVLGAVLG